MRFQHLAVPGQMGKPVRASKYDDIVGSAWPCLVRGDQVNSDKYVGMQVRFLRADGTPWQRTSAQNVNGFDRVYIDSFGVLELGWFDLILVAYDTTKKNAEFLGENLQDSDLSYVEVQYFAWIDSELSHFNHVQDYRV